MNQESNTSLNKENAQERASQRTPWTTPNVKYYSRARDIVESGGVPYPTEGVNYIS